MTAAELKPQAADESFQVIPPRNRLRSKVRESYFPAVALIARATSALAAQESGFVLRARHAADEIRRLVVQAQPIGAETIVELARGIRDEAGSFGRYSLGRIARSLMTLAESPGALGGKLGDLALAHADAIRAALSLDDGWEAQSTASSLDDAVRRLRAHPSREISTPSGGGR